MRVGGDIHVGSDPISAEYHHVKNMTSLTELDSRTTEVVREKWRGKKPACGFCPFLGVLRSVGTVSA